MQSHCLLLQAGHSVVPLDPMECLEVHIRPSSFTHSSYFACGLSDRYIHIHCKKYSVKRSCDPVHSPGHGGRFWTIIPAAHYRVQLLNENSYLWVKCKPDPTPADSCINQGRKCIMPIDDSKVYSNRSSSFALDISKWSIGVRYL